MNRYWSIFTMLLMHLSNLFNTKPWEKNTMLLKMKMIHTKKAFTLAAVCKIMVYLSPTFYHLLSQKLVGKEGCVGVIVAAMATL